MIIGWEPEIRAITREDLQNFYRDRYAPANAVLLVSGDAREAEVRRLADELYSPVPARPHKGRERGGPPPGPVVVARDDRAQHAVDLVTTGQGGLEQLPGRQLPGAQAALRMHVGGEERRTRAANRRLGPKGDFQEHRGPPARLQVEVEHRAAARGRLRRRFESETRRARHRVQPAI